MGSECEILWFLCKFKAHAHELVFVRARKHIRADKSSACHCALKEHVFRLWPLSLFGNSRSLFLFCASIHTL